MHVAHSPDEQRVNHMLAKPRRLKQLLRVPHKGGDTNSWQQPESRK